MDRLSKEHFRVEGDVSVVIVLNSEREPIQHCLERLKASSLVPFEVILVWNGPRLFLEPNLDAFQRHSFIRCPAPLGIAEARNLGAAQASGQLLLFLDPDVEMGVHTLTQMVANLKSQEVDAIFGSYDGVSPHGNFASQFKALFNFYYHQTASPDAATFWSACGLIRRSAFFSVGGYNPEYRVPAIEDIALGYRLRDRGFRIRLDRTILVRHLKYWSLPNLIFTDLFRRAIPWTLLLIEESRPHFELNLNLRNRASVLLALCIFPGVLFWGMLGVSLSFLVWLAINVEFLVLCKKRRGLGFLVQSTLMLVLISFYSGVGYLLGHLQWGYKRVCGVRLKANAHAPIHSNDLPRDVTRKVTT